MNKNKVLSVTAGATLLAIMAACGSTPQDSGTKIVNGQAVSTNEWKAVVGLVYQNQIFCTGTAIAPRLIVTAAHCLKAVPPSATSIYVGSGSLRSGVSAPYKVASGKIHPTYVANSDEGQDVAYLVTDRDIEGVTFPEVLINAQEEAQLLATNATSTLVGFGFRGNDPFGSQTNSAGENLSGAKYAVDVKVVGPKNSYEVLVDANNRGACKGDSGGPAFGVLPNGELRVYGVTSRANKMGTPLCGNPNIPTVYGLMRPSICWIQSESGVSISGKVADFCGTTTVPPVNGEAKSFGPFANNLSNKLLLTLDQGARVSFDLEVDMEDGYDYLNVTTGLNKTGQFTGKKTYHYDNLVTPLKFSISTDGSKASNGFKVKNITYSP